MKPFMKEWCEWKTYPSEGPFETGILWRSAPRWDIVDCARRPVGIFAPAARIGGKIRRIGPWQSTVGYFTARELAQWEARTDPILELGSGTPAQILMRLPPGTRTIIRSNGKAPKSAELSCEISSPTPPIQIIEVPKPLRDPPNGLDD